MDDDGRIFFQRRSPARKLFPNSWDIVRVDGDLSRPRLEEGKHTEFRWLGPDDLAVLDESAAINDGMIRRIAEDGFAVLHTLGM